jgi:hypothetical protein
MNIASGPAPINQIRVNSGPVQTQAFRIPGWNFALAIPTFYSFVG